MAVGLVLGLVQGGFAACPCLGWRWGCARGALGSLKGGLGLIWGGLISGGLRVFKGMLFVCFGLNVGWFRVGLGWFRVGFAVGFGLDVGLGLASLDLGLGQARLRVSGCAESWIRVDSWLVQGGLMVGLGLVCFG